MQLQKQKLSKQELLPGLHARIMHTPHMTLVFWDIEHGADLPEHSHRHEQVVQLLEGSFELVVNGNAQLLSPGDVVVIPGNVPHSGKALTACVIQDTFVPPREDMEASILVDSM